MIPTAQATARENRTEATTSSVRRTALPAPPRGRRLLKPGLAFLGIALISLMIKWENRGSDELKIRHRSAPAAFTSMHLTLRTTSSNRASSGVSSRPEDTDLIRPSLLKPLDLQSTDKDSEAQGELGTLSFEH